MRELESHSVLRSATTPHTYISSSSKKRPPPGPWSDTANGLSLWILNSARPCQRPAAAQARGEDPSRHFSMCTRPAGVCAGMTVRPPSSDPMMFKDRRWIGSSGGWRPLCLLAVASLRTTRIPHPAFISASEAATVWLRGTLMKRVTSAAVAAGCLAGTHDVTK